MPLRIIHLLYRAVRCFLCPSPVLVLYDWNFWRVSYAMSRPSQLYTSLS
jgi:hypothetical protein